MKLYNSNENWQELLCDAIDAAERTHGVDLDPCFYTEYAEELRRMVLRDLPEYMPVYQQRVGSYVIIQDATPEERDVFIDLVDKHLPEVARLLAAAVEQVSRGTATVEQVEV